MPQGGRLTLRTSRHEPLPALENMKGVAPAPALRLPDHRRHRLRHQTAPSGLHLRPVFHHQSQRLRPGPLQRPPRHRKTSGRHLRRFQGRRGHEFPNLAARSRLLRVRAAWKRPRRASATPAAASCSSASPAKCSIKPPNCSVPTITKSSPPPPPTAWRDLLQSSDYQFRRRLPPCRTERSGPELPARRSAPAEQRPSKSS